MLSQRKKIQGTSSIATAYTGFLDEEMYFRELFLDTARRDLMHALP